MSVRLQSKSKRSAGQVVCQLAVRAVIATLRRQQYGLSGAGESALSVWQEFSLQVQGERCAFWDAYVAHIEQAIEGVIVSLPAADQVALYLSTPDGRAWLEVDQAERDSTPPVEMGAMVALAYGKVIAAAMDDECAVVAAAQCSRRGRLDCDLVQTDEGHE